MGMAIDCKTCLHEKVCDLWLQQERQDASCFCLDGCDYFDPTLTPPNEWVSVEERLPDKPGHYLVCTSINYWHGGCMDVNQEHKYYDSGTPVGYDGTTMSVLDCYYDITGDWNRVCNKHVTHWMLLPAPPDSRPPEGEEEI